MCCHASDLPTARGSGAAAGVRVRNVGVNRRRHIGPSRWRTSGFFRRVTDSGGLMANPGTRPALATARVISSTPVANATTRTTADALAPSAIRVSTTQPGRRLRSLSQRDSCSDSPASHKARAGLAGYSLPRTWACPFDGYPGEPRPADQPVSWVRRERASASPPRSMAITPTPKATKPPTIP
jgi:hypothetical protein